jgi:hypothetical protein
LEARVKSLGGTRGVRVAGVAGKEKGIVVKGEISGYFLLDAAV